MKETEQSKYNILRKLNGLGPIINSEWEFIVEQSKTLRHIEANVVGADKVQENILDLLCRLQSAQDKATEEEQKEGYWIDKFNDVNGEKRNVKDKYDRLYSRLEELIRKMELAIAKFRKMNIGSALIDMESWMNDLEKAIKAKEDIPEEEMKAVVAERKDG